MPIEGLTDRVRFPRLGKIHLGVRAVNAKGVEYPRAVDYFVCDHPDFQKVYPGEPREVDVVFPTDSPEDWASQFYRAYSRTRGLVCKGDGITANRLINAKTGETSFAAADAKETAWADLECPGRGCPYYQAKQCREIMMLQFLLPRVPGLGIWQLDTSSINSILNVNSCVQLIKALNNGKIAMVPLKLQVVPQEVTPGGLRKTVYVLQITSQVRLAELSQAFLALPEAEDEMPSMLFPTEEETAAAQEAESATRATTRAEKPPDSPKAVEVTPRPLEGRELLLTPEGDTSSSRVGTLMGKRDDFAQAYADAFGWDLPKMTKAQRDDLSQGMRIWLADTFKHYPNISHELSFDTLSPEEQDTAIGMLKAQARGEQQKKEREKTLEQEEQETMF